jgi:hypothetical protein
MEAAALSSGVPDRQYGNSALLYSTQCMYWCRLQCSTLQFQFIHSVEHSVVHSVQYSAQYRYTMQYSAQLAYMIQFTV